MSAAALVPLRFFIDEEGLSRGLTLELRDEDLEDSGLVFIICLLLLFLGDGFNNLALLTLTAEAALFAIDTVIGDVSINPILLKATRAFWSLGVTLVEPFCCNDVDN